MKAFDCLSHDLLIAKLHGYGLDIDSLTIHQDYLSLSSYLTIMCDVQKAVYHSLIFYHEYVIVQRIIPKNALFGNDRVQPCVAGNATCLFITYNL